MHPYLTTLLGILIFAVPVSPLRASTPATHGTVLEVPVPDPVLEPWRWQFFSSSDGPAGTRIRQILQAKSGLWFATDAGVSRYDGLHWTHYPAPKPLPSNDVRALAEDTRGRIWMGTAAGVVRYDPALGSDLSAWKILSNSDGLPDVGIRDVCVTRDNVVWVATSKGVARLVGDRFETFSERDGLAHGIANDLAQGADGKVWVATEAGVSRFDGTTWHTYRRGNGLPGTSVTSAYATRDGDIWFPQYGAGLTRFSDGTWDTFGKEDGLPDLQVGEVFETLDGRIWALCRTGIAVLADGKTNKARWRSYGRSEIQGLGEPSAAAVDALGAIWIAARGGRGLARFDYVGTRWSSFELNDVVQSQTGAGIGQDADGGIWFGVGAGAVRYDELRWVDRPAVLQRVTQVATTEDGAAYLLGGDREGGRVVEVTGASRRVVGRVFEGELPTAACRMPEDGRLWVATDSGNLYKLDPEDDSWEPVQPNVQLPRTITTVALTTEGHLYIAGSSGNLVLRTAGKSWRSMSVKRGEIESLWPGKDGSLWIAHGASGGGLTRFETKTGAMRTYSMSDGLPHDEVYALATVNGITWAGTAVGIAAYDPDADAWVVPRGVPELDVRGLYGARDGALWMRTSLGVVARYWNDQQAPETVLNNPPESVPAAGNVNFSWEGHDAWQSGGESIDYSYRLDGGPWSPFASRDRLALTALTDGMHRFEIRARDADLNIETAVVAHSFVVAIPLWKSPWFIGTLVLLLGTIAWQAKRILVRDRELAAANERLKEVDRMKTDFFSNVSHELRTPMTAIKGYVDNMLDGIAGDITERQGRYLNRVKSNADRLTGLINDLLDLSRIDRGRTDLLQLSPTKLKARDVVLETLEEIRPLADSKGLALTFDGADSLVNADRNRLKQIVYNLVGNAIKFTDQGEISVRVKPDGTGFVQTIVRDTGVGMTAEDARRVFDRFYQVKSAQGVTPGTGLGLPITKELVELHGGQIWAESEPGEGSVFTFTIPEIVERAKSTTHAG